MLVEEKKVTPGDVIDAYLPDIPPSWQGITVKHLLSHTSGLADRFEGSLGGQEFRESPTSALFDTAHETPIEYPPGERWLYSDPGYFLLGMIIEQAARHVLSFRFACRQAPYVMSNHRTKGGFRHIRGSNCILFILG